MTFICFSCGAGCRFVLVYRRCYRYRAGVGGLMRRLEACATVYTPPDAWLVRLAVCDTSSCDCQSHHAPGCEHGWRGSMAAALHPRASRAGSGIPAGVRDRDEVRLFVGFCDTRFDVRHAPTLPRPRWGRESPLSDGFRCCKLVQWCGIPLNTGIADWCRWCASRRLALPGAC